MNSNRDTEFLKNSDLQSPESILEQFVIGLAESIKTIEDLLPGLLEIEGQGEGEVLFGQLRQPVVLVNENILLAIEYLNSRPHSRTQKSENAADLIITTFAHELRNPALLLAGFLDICQLYSLSQGQFSAYISTIEGNAKSVVELFNILEKNWRIWLETENLDQEKIYKFEAGEVRKERPSQADRRIKNRMIFDPEPGKLEYGPLDKLNRKDQVIIHRLVELGVTIRNAGSNEFAIIVEVPHNLADTLNIEIGFLLNELAPGDFAENLREICSCKDSTVDLSKIRIEEAKWGIRFKPYLAYLKYYIEKREPK